MNFPQLARRAFLLLLGAALSASAVVAQSPRYPGIEWPRATATWSGPALDSAKKLFAAFPPANLFVVHHGEVVVDWGFASQRIKVSSVRKSFLSALFGIQARAGRLDLERTLRQVGIDDEPPLNEGERAATLHMLLESRSGVYHPYVGGSPQDRARMPERGSHAPGTFWYYNNWDFNALGTAFEKETGTKIGAEFVARIARPTQMQDFRPEDQYYFGGTSATRGVEQSVHPAYHFRISARDLARFGYLFLRRGAWNGKQLIPADWVDESTKPISDAGGGGGYGYLWWVDGFPGVSEHSYSARGALAKYLVVFPACDLVVVFLNHQEFPDDAAAFPAEEIAKLPTVSVKQIGELLGLLLRAREESVRQ